MDRSRPCLLSSSARARRVASGDAVLAVNWRAPVFVPELVRSESAGCLQRSHLRRSARDERWTSESVLPQSPLTRSTHICDGVQRHHRGGDRRDAMPRPQRSSSLMMYPGRSQTSGLGASSFFGRAVLGDQRSRVDQRVTPRFSDRLDPLGCNSAHGCTALTVQASTRKILCLRLGARPAGVILRDPARVGIGVIRARGRRSSRGRYGLRGNGFVGNRSRSCPCRNGSHAASSCSVRCLAHQAIELFENASACPLHLVGGRRDIERRSSRERAPRRSKQTPYTPGFGDPGVRGIAGRPDRRGAAKPIRGCGGRGRPG